MVCFYRFADGTKKLCSFQMVNIDLMQGVLECVNCEGVGRQKA